MIELTDDVIKTYEKIIYGRIIGYLEEYCEETKNVNIDIIKEAGIFAKIVLTAMEKENYIDITDGVKDLGNDLSKWPLDYFTEIIYENCNLYKIYSDRCLRRTNII